MHLRISSATSQPFRPGGDELTHSNGVDNSLLVGAKLPDQSEKNTLFSEGISTHYDNPAVMMTQRRLRHLYNSTV